MEPAAVLRLLLTAEGVKETQLQLARVNAEAKRTADSTGRLEQAFSRANNKTSDFNRNMMGLRNVIGLIKWPALIAGAGGAAQAIGAAGVASVGIVGNFLALAQGAGVVHLAMNNVSKALSGNKKAFQDLTPAQKTFVDQLKSMKPELQSIQNVAAQGLFPGVVDALKTMSPLMGRLRPVISATAQVMGSLAEAAARMLVSMGPALTRIGNNNVQVLHNLGIAAIGLIKGFLGIMDAARPLTLWLSQTFAHLATQFANWTTSMRGQNQLKQFFAQAQPAIHQVFLLIGQIAKALFQVFRPQPGTAGMIAQLGQLVQVLGGVLTTTARTLGPPLIHLIVNLVRILSSLAGTSGPLTFLVKTLAAITTPIARAVSHNPALGTMASFLAGVGVTWKVLSLLKSPLESIVLNVKRLTDLTQKVIAFGSSWGGLKGKVAQGVEGAGQELGQFPRKVTNTMNDAEGAAKTGSGKIMDQFRSVFTKVNLFRGFGIALGVALVGGLVTMIAKGLAKDDPEARGRQWAGRFLRGVNAVRGGTGRGPIINPLPIPAQSWFTQQAGHFVGKYVSAMDQKTFLARFARGATYLVDNPQIRAQTEKAAAGLATVIVRSFAQRWSQVRIPSTPAFVSDVMMYLNRLPPWARGAAARAMAEYAAGLEAHRKLPVGATTDTIVAIESKWPALVRYLGNVSAKSSKAVADGFKFDAARKSVVNTLTFIRNQWGLQQRFDTSNLAGMRASFKNTWDYLQYQAQHGTKHAREVATRELDKLRASGAAILLGLQHVTGDRMTQIGTIVGTQTARAAGLGSGHFFTMQHHMQDALDRAKGSTDSNTRRMLDMVSTRTSALAAQGARHLVAFQGSTTRSMGASAATTNTNTRHMLDNASTRTADMAANAAHNMGRFSGNIAGGMQGAWGATRQGIGLINSAVAKALNSLGSSAKIDIKLAAASVKNLFTGHARGGMVNTPSYVVGEEAPRHPEVVIATNPAYRAKNVEYWMKAGQMLGMPGFKEGGIPGYATGGYVYPFNRATRFERVDQGVDFNAPAGSPIGAIGDFMVTAATARGSGWTSPENTQAGIVYRLMTGPRAGRFIYVSEDIVPRVRAGQRGKAGQIIASFKSSPTGLETGWATGRGFGAIAPGGSLNSAAGLDFEHFIQGLAHGKLVGGLFGLVAPHLKTPQVSGKGAFAAMAQAALSRVTAAANSKIQAIAATMMPTGTGSIGSFPTGSGNVLRDVYNTLKARGWSKIAIAGALGNAWRESRWQPGSQGSGGGGLWGFTAHPNSLSDLQAAARSRGVSWTDAAFQAAFMAAHFDGRALGSLNRARSPSEAAQIFEQVFEHAGNISMSDRIAGANRAYAMGFRKGGFLPPYAGSFANGGMVPGPTGAARTAIVHGGETISSNTTSGPLVNIEYLDVHDDFDESMLAHKLAFLIDR